MSVALLPILTNRPILPILPNQFHLNHYYYLNHKMPTVHYMGFHLVLDCFPSLSAMLVTAEGERGSWGRAAASLIESSAPRDVNCDM